MSYINTDNVISCSHPKVKMIFQSGGNCISDENKSIRMINIILEDGTRKDFSDYGEGKAIEDAEQWLINIPQ